VTLAFKELNFYYLRWIVPAVSRTGAPGPVEGDRAARVVAYAATAVSLGLGLAGGPVLDALAG
jgi:NADH-quinone oxidoreductase subunit N